MHRSIFRLARKLKPFRPTGLNIIKKPADKITSGYIFAIASNLKNCKQLSGLEREEGEQIYKEILKIQKLQCGIDILTRQGARSFLNYYYEKLAEDNGSDDELNALVIKINNYLGDIMGVIRFPKEMAMENNNFVVGHKKFEVLREMIVDHFKNPDNHGTKAGHLH